MAASVSPVRFDGFSPKALRFFKQLEKNNDRDWFSPRKSFFDTDVRGPMIKLVSLLFDDLRKIAVDYVVDDPRKAIYRIYRDTRFSKDKTPYKTHIGASFGRRGLPRHMAGELYVGVSHLGVEVAGGMYMPGPVELSAVRQAIVRSHQRFESLIADRSLKRLFGAMKGERLVRVPKGFAADGPASKWTCCKQFYFHATLAPEVALKPTLHQQVSKRFQILLPFVEFINDAVAAATLAEHRPDESIPKRPPGMF